MLYGPGQARVLDFLSAPCPSWVGAAFHQLGPAVPVLLFFADSRLVSAMETQHIRYFLAVSEQLNFTRAAERCGVAQPTVTAAIQRLERDVGGALFDRLPYPPYVKLTSLGHQLHPLCLQIDELLAKAQTISRSLKDTSTRRAHEARRALRPA